MRYGLIGAGRVGAAFFYQLKRAGFEISGIYDIKRESIKKAKSILGKEFYIPIKKLIRSSDVLFIATSDAQIKNVYRRINNNLNSGTFLYHFSGSLPARILKNKNIHQGSLHPLGTFPDYQAYKKLKSYYFGLEGDKTALTVAKRILNKISLKYLVVKSDRKTVYHLASVFGSNLIVGLLTMAQSLAEYSGIDRDKFIKFFIPLIAGTVADIKIKGLAGSLSGPVERSEIATIKRHQRELKKIGPGYLKTYNLLSSYLLKLTPRHKKGKISKILNVH